MMGVVVLEESPHPQRPIVLGPHSPNCPNVVILLKDTNYIKIG